MAESSGAEPRPLLRKSACYLVLLFALLGAGAAQSDDSSGGPEILLFRVLPTIEDSVHWHEFHWEVANTHRVRLFQNGTENPGRTQLSDGSMGWPLSMSGALRMRLKATATWQLVAEDQAGNSVSESQVAEVQAADGLKTDKTVSKKTKPPLAGSQGFAAVNVSDQTELSHGGDFFDDHIVVDGTIKNIGPKRFPCLMVVFGFETSQGRKQDALKIRDLGSGEERSYSQRFPLANSVWHVSTLTCAPAETDIPVKHCTVTGELLAQRGFIQRVADRPNDPGTIYRLNEVLLIRGRDVIDRAPLGPGETVRSFHFKRVPVGETFQIGLGSGWAFQGFEQVRVQCGQPSGTRNIGRKQIMTVGEG